MIGDAVMGDVMMDDRFMTGVSNYLLPDNILQLNMSRIVSKTRVNRSNRVAQPQPRTSIIKMFKRTEPDLRVSSTMIHPIIRKIFAAVQPCLLLINVYLEHVLNLSLPHG